MRVRQLRRRRLVDGRLRSRFEAISRALLNVAGIDEALVVGPLLRGPLKSGVDSELRIAIFDVLGNDVSEGHCRDERPVGCASRRPRPSQGGDVAARWWARAHPVRHALRGPLRRFGRPNWESPFVRHESRFVPVLLRCAGVVSENPDSPRR